ncbi:MAG: hypothetical protein NVS3B1_17800 [Marmoricola sp.]
MAKLTRAEEVEAQKKIAKGLKALPENFLDCRDLRHSWKKAADYRPREQKMEGGTKLSPLLYRSLICARCGTGRTDVIYARTYERLSVAYTYPENYQIPGVPRGTKQSTILRQESVRRANLAAAKAQRWESEAAEG